jgi:hypothetical protein
VFYWFLKYAQQCIILTCSTPLVWKISSVVLIPKVHSPTEKFDYRRISIQPVLPKAFENVMYEQMVNYVGRNGLLSAFQSGFRPDLKWRRINK